MKRINTFFLVLLSFQVYAQQVSDSLAYREDQVYLDVNFLIQSNALNNFRQNGFSRSLHAGFLRDIPLNERGNRSVALGLGYGYQRLVNTLDISLENEIYTYTLPNNSRTLRNILSYHQLQFPIELRWRTSTATNFDFWRIYLSYRLSYQFAGRYQPFFGRPFGLKNQLSSWQHSFGLSFGFGSWNLRFAHEIVPLFVESTQLETGNSPRIYPIHLGLIFYFL